MIRKLPGPVAQTPAIEDVRKAVSDLAKLSTEAVKAVRGSFASGQAPYQTAGSGSVASYVSAFASGALGSAIVRSTSRLGLVTSTAGSAVPPPRPELDDAEIFEDRGGMLDQFSVRLTISLRNDELSRVAGVRVMRARIGKVNVPRPSISALSAVPATPGNSLDRISLAADRVAEIGVGNKLTEFVSNDVGGRQITSPAARELRAPVPTPNSNKTSGGSADLIALQGADRSVRENLSFYLNRRSFGDVPAPAVGVVRGGSKSGINVLKGASVSTVQGGIVQASNAMQFSEVGRIDPTSPGSRSVGDFTEFTFLDRSVVYGAGFCYYVVSVGHDGGQSVRSRLVNVEVVRHIPPTVPAVSYAIVGSHPRFSVKCEPGVDHVEVFRSGRSVEESIRLGGDDGIVTQEESIRVGEFWHLRDLGVGTDGSTTFVDTQPVGGDRLEYRFYSVDPYGLKSQTPFSCSIFMPEHGRAVPLAVPSVTVEQDSGLPAVIVRMHIDDPRASAFMVQRKELTVGERALHQANQPEWVNLRARDAKRANSRRGPTLMDTDWPLIIPVAAGSASFRDDTVRIDRRYQYAVGAIDLRGNRTPLASSPPVAVYAKPLIDPPAAFSADVVDEGGVLKAVRLSWTPGTVDFSPNALLGDQDVLAATAVRSVFQVERRSVGSSFWDAMPATSESWFVDPVSDAAPPSFRPAYPIAGGQYEYRVMSMQSGGFVSPRTEIVRVTVVPSPGEIDTVWVRTSPLSVSPMISVVSWNMSGEFVERWEVERAVTNKVFGDGVASMDSRAARSLPYVRVANITPEASRARGMATDGALDPTVYVGNRFYVDPDVDKANSYFYRVRTVSRTGASSEWTYAGLLIKDSSFDRKFYSTLSDDARVALALSSGSFRSIP